jgi:hypothetical protein
MATLMTTEKRIEMVNRYIAEKPKDWQQWAMQNGYAVSGLENAVFGYARKNGITNKTGIEMLRLGFIALDDIKKYWREDARNSNDVCAKLEDIERRLTHIEVQLGLRSEV